MDKINELKTIVIALFGVLASYLGILYIPVNLMVLCNIIDYVTGILAAPKREGKRLVDSVKSYKSINGIIKKITMWILVVVGAILDQLIKYAMDIGCINVKFNFLIACLVCVWIICNELISILENIRDIGVNLPPFLMPLVEKVKGKIEDTAEKEIEDTEGEE